VRNEHRLLQTIAQIHTIKNKQTNEINMASSKRGIWEKHTV